MPQPVPHELRTITTGLRRRSRPRARRGLRAAARRRGGSGTLPVLGDIRAHEALVDREAEHEGVAGSEAALHLVQVREHTPVHERLMLLRLVVGRLRRLLREPRDVVGPRRLGADADLRNALHPVADHRPAVGVDRAFQGALVVIDEETRGHEVGQLLLDLLVLERSTDRVCGAATELTLVVDLRHAGPQIDLLRKLRQDRFRRRIHEVPGIRKIGDPTEPLHCSRAESADTHYVPPRSVASLSATLTVRT